MYKVTVKGREKQYPAGTTYEQLAIDFQGEYDCPIVLASSKGKLRELFREITGDVTVDFLTMKDSEGSKTYVRMATMLFLKSVHDLFGREAAQNTRVEFMVGAGLYINPRGSYAALPEHAEKIKNRMQELVAGKVPVIKKVYPLEEAMELFRQRGMKDKEKLFRYRRSSWVNLYEIEDYWDYYYGYMLPHTGYIKWFDVIAYDEGFMMVLPTASNPTKVEPYKESPKLFATLKTASMWGKEVGVETVGDLNDQICSGSLSEMILMHEARQERLIAEIAADIASRGCVKFIMIAGPSSSGKTTFSHRLSVQLRTLGMRPHPIALDDYFVDREKTPRDENGDYNFECLEAIDVRQFNEDMTRLLAGEKVELPSFNFKTGKREYNGRYKQLGAEDVLVIEGIHGLNGKTSYSLPEESKYKIYISALTTLNIDGHNRIPIPDARLLRRMVRDVRTRGADATRTIQMWPSVRRGEEENIFPFQEEADAMFNSALIYELSVLKQYAEALLFGVQRGTAEFYEANRLLKFLNYFLGVNSDNIPQNSICREFVGGSCFQV